MKKFDFIIILFILLMSVSMTTHAAAAKSEENFEEKEVILTNPDGDDIDVYDNVDDPSPVVSLSNDTKVNLLEEEADFSFIRYDADGKQAEGYVKNECIVVANDAEEMPIDNDENEAANIDNNKTKQANEDVESEADSSNEQKKTASATTSESVKGIAQKQPTPVYQSKSKNSKQLKTYKKGTELKYIVMDDDWYQATVKVNGKWEKGYIHSSDVDHSEKTKVQTLEGYALKDPTNVYKNAGQSSVANADVWKSYPAGEKLKYKTYNDNWYQATVYVNGVKQTGYIHKDDVDANMPTLQGYAQQGKATVYASASKSGDVLKEYLQGKLLKYQPYNDSFYQAKVKINGKYQTGYIPKSDVGSDQPALQGYAQQKATNVYASKSKNADVLKKYPAGQLLKFKEHNASWYEAKVKVGGKYQTGYIYKNDVGSSVPSFKGYAQSEGTTVYGQTSKVSKVLKSYEAGSLLKYRPYNDSWYEVTVIIGGKKQTGYIATSQIGDKVPSLSGFSNKSPTSVYSSTSRSSSVLKTYKKGTMLKYKPYNSSWYKATVYVGNQKKTGYINKADVLKPVGKTVVIDAGHGGSDPGASANGIAEKDLVLELAKQTQKELEKSGFEVIMTRTTDEFIALKERTKLANDAKSNLFLSIHANSGGGKGIETWWYSKGPEAAASKEFAQDVQSEVIKETGAVNRGTKDGNLHVNRESNSPSSLIEVGFVDNNEEAKQLKQTSYKNKIVKGIVQGIKKYFGLPF